MNIFISVTSSNGEVSPIDYALKAIIDLTPNTVVESIDEAEVVIVDDVHTALDLLRKTQVRVIVFTVGDTHKVGADALAGNPAFAGRITHCPLIGENELVLHLLTLTE